MCNTSNDFTVSLDYVSHFLSIHKAELFFNALAGGGMRNPFSEKLRWKTSICNFISLSATQRGKSARKAKLKKAPENTSDNVSPSLYSFYFNKCKLRKDIWQYRIHNSSLH